MLLDKVKIQKPFEFIGRAAQRSMIGTLNFSISNLATRAIRLKLANAAAEGDVEKVLQKPTAQALKDLQQKFSGGGGGNTLDARNELDEAERGREHEEQMRQDQGYTVQEDPLEMAGRLLVVRDCLAADMNDHAVLRRNPLDPHGAMYKDPYSLAPTLEQTFIRQLEQAPKVNEKRARAQAEAMKLPYESVLRVLRAEQEASQRFLKANKDDIHGFLTSLKAYRPLRDDEDPDEFKAQGIEVTVDKDGRKSIPWQNEDADYIFENLPAIRQAGLYVAADRGLWYEMDRWIRARLRSHPDSLGNMKAIVAARQDIHAEFGRRMANPAFKQEISEAVERGATWPTLLVIESIEALRAA